MPLWLAEVVSSDARFGLSLMVLSAVVRITDKSSRLQGTERNRGGVRVLEDLLGQPHCQVVEPGERHWDIFRRLCIETDTRGSRALSDAWFAALAIEWGCEWITLDRDYAQFPGLAWQVPAARPTA